MKRLMAGVLVALMVVLGAGLATAAELPQALTGVNLSTAQVLTPDQAQQVRGTMAPMMLPHGFEFAMWQMGIFMAADMNRIHSMAMNYSRVFMNLMR